MNIIKLEVHPSTMHRRALAVLLAAALSLIAAEHVRAATPEPAMAAAATAPATAPATKPAHQCLTDLAAFQVQMQKDGYWRGSSGYGYGYPMHGYAYDEARPVMNDIGTPSGTAYWRARPGYDIRTLLASAQILAQRGQQQPCEALLATTREIYGPYARDLRSGNVPSDNGDTWRREQLAAAQPVASSKMSYRSDQLIGTEVVNAKGESLGSVDDMVLSPKTGQIAYLVIGRGGLFGINEKYVPVPWAAFKATAGAKLLVLDTTKADMTAAPHVNENRFSASNDFAKQSQQVDTYWTAHLTK
jgi:sporulation protein YlmC with PRC-barrel domain